MRSQFFSELTTARLLLRPMTTEDAPALYALRSDPKVVQHTGAGHGSLQQSEEYIRRMDESMAVGEDFAWALARREAPEKMLGLVCLWDKQPDGGMFIGYELQPAAWGRGYMGEAVEAALAHSFGALRLPRVLADPREENKASVALLASHGFALVDRFMRPGQDGRSYMHLLYERRP